MLRRVWMTAWDAREIYVPEFDQLRKGISERVLAGFDNIEQEANDLSDAYYKRVCESPADEDTDVENVMAQAAETAQDIGIEHYHTMKQLEQSVLNLAAIAYAHAFEQQFLRFHRNAVESHDVQYQRRKKDSPGDAEISCLGEFEKAKGCLKSNGIDIETVSTWSMVEVLRWAANVAKHGEGKSAERLRTKRPELFNDPLLGGEPLVSHTGQAPFRDGPVEQPLTGEDFYVTRAHLDVWAEAVLTFWRELADQLAPNNS